jgi:hypothetical protein
MVIPEIERLLGTIDCRFLGNEMLELCSDTIISIILGREAQQPINSSGTEIERTGLKKFRSRFGASVFRAFRHGAITVSIESGRTFNLA